MSNITKNEIMNYIAEEITELYNYTIEEAKKIIKDINLMQEYENDKFAGHRSMYEWAEYAISLK